MMQDYFGAPGKATSHRRIAELQNRVANHSPHSQSVTERRGFQNVTGSSAAHLLPPNFLPLEVFSHLKVPLSPNSTRVASRVFNI